MSVATCVFETSTLKEVQNAGPASSHFLMSYTSVFVYSFFNRTKTASKSPGHKDCIN
jgi:hypothetical protein